MYVASLTAPTERRRIGGGLRSVYASGHLLFVRDRTLLAQPFDPVTATSTGDPVAVASSVATWEANDGIPWFSASPGGTLAYFSGPRANLPFQLARVDREC